MKEPFIRIFLGIAIDKKNCMPKKFHVCKFTTYQRAIWQFGQFNSIDFSKKQEQEEQFTFKFLNFSFSSLLAFWQ